MSGDETNIDPSIFTAAGERVAEILERAATPAKPPVAVTGPSPADAAAATLAALMGAHITAASAELAPRGPKIREATRAAVAELQAQDRLNAQQIRAVSPAEQLLTEEATGGIDTGAKGEGGVADGGQKEPFSWKPTLQDMLLGGQTGAAGAASDYARTKASGLIRGVPDAPDAKLLPWLEDSRINGFSRVAAGVGSVSAIPAFFADYAEAKAAGAGTGKAVTIAATREVPATAAGLWGAGLGTGAGEAAAASLIEIIGADAIAGAAGGSVVPGLGTAAGLVGGALVGGAMAFATSKGIDLGWRLTSDSVMAVSEESVYGFAVGR